jgi:hypothetical protein
MIASASLATGTGGGFKRENKMNLLDTSTFDDLMNAQQNEERKVQREKDRKREEKERIEEEKRERIEAKRQKAEDEKQRRQEERGLCKTF